MSKKTKKPIAHKTTKQNDGRGDIIRIVQKLADDVDPCGLTEILHSLVFELSSGTHSTVEVVAIFTGMLDQMRPAAIGAMHLAAVEQEAVNDAMHAEWIVEDAKLARRKAAVAA